MTKKIDIKPLTVNQAWRGQRFKTPEYKAYERAMFYLLPSFKVPKGKLSLMITFGLSNKNSDIDNPLKPFLDCLQKRYDFNDKQIYELIVDKLDVKKGEEFIYFDITPYESNTH